MQLTDILQSGMGREELFTVQDEHSAAHVGSGSARVLATPWLIAFMERTARDLLADVLPEGYTSVGIHVDVRHLAPSPILPIGARILMAARCPLTGSAFTTPTPLLPGLRSAKAKLLSATTAALSVCRFGPFLTIYCR